MLQRIVALTIKEFLALLRDPRSRVVVILPPILQLLIFGYAATFNLREVPIAVYDQDGGAAARDLVARFSGSPNFSVATYLERNAQIAPLIDRRSVLMVLHLGPHFSRDLMVGRPAPVQLVVDGRNSNTAALALNYARAIVSGFNQDWAAQHNRPAPPAELVTRAWFNPNLDSRWFLVSGLVGLLTLLVTLLVTSLSVAREREQGTFDQLLVTPLRPVEIIVGKALPGMIIGVLEATIIVLGAVFWFGIPLRGSVLTLYTGVLLFVLSAIGFGLMISSFSATLQQALLGAFLFMMPAVILSGFATPIANMSPWVQRLTLLNPVRYFLVIVRGVFLQGTPFSLLIHQFWPMAVIGLATLAVAGWLFRHRLY